MNNPLNALKNGEKKVEYIELIYDLIFVYMIGRNNSILSHVEGGFIDLKTFAAYALCTLAIIQIWNFTTFYINMFGRNGIRDHIFLFINMYLLYFVGESTRMDWLDYQMQYHIAWGLILVNIGIQYFLELRNHKMDLWNRDIIRRMCIALFAEAAIVFTASFVAPFISTILSAAAIAAGIMLTAVSRKKSIGGQTDFMHLSERAMLFVVFTFGEMIITLAAYFTGDGGWNWNVIYFSLMAFTVVVMLFLSYEMIYDYLIDREGDYDGMLYLAIHIFIIFTMNNITVSFEFMREPEIELLPKTVFLACSMVGYFVSLALLYRYMKVQQKPGIKMIVKMLVTTSCFVLLMILLRGHMYANIAVSVIFAVIMFLFLVWGRKDKAKSV